MVINSTMRSKFCEKSQVLRYGVGLQQMCVFIEWLSRYCSNGFSGDDSHFFFQAFCSFEKLSSWIIYPPICRRANHFSRPTTILEFSSSTRFTFRSVIVDSVRYFAPSFLTEIKLIYEARNCSTAIKYGHFMRLCSNLRATSSTVSSNKIPLRE